MILLIFTTKMRRKTLLMKDHDNYISRNPFLALFLRIVYTQKTITLCGI